MVSSVCCDSEVIEIVFCKFLSVFDLLFFSMIFFSMSLFSM